MPPPDEDAYRSLRTERVGLACAFERALLSRCAACSLARSTLLAEREAIGCSSASASERCRAYRESLRAKALFALRVDASAPWPFGKEIRLQCGGLLGLRRALANGDAHPQESEARAAEPVADADALMRAALERHLALDALPYSVIIRSVTGYSPRRRVRR